MGVHSLPRAVVWLTAMLLSTAAAVHARTISVEGNDSAAIAAAIARSQAGDTVRLPAGTYSITESVVPKARIKLLGDGQDRTILRFTGQNPASMVDLSGLRTGCEIAGFTLDGASNPNAGQGISGTNSSHLSIHDIIVRNLVKSQSWGPHGILFSGVNPTRANGVTDTIIRDCLFESIAPDSEWGGGVRMQWGSSRNQVLNCVVRNAGRGGIFGGDGSTDLVIRGNTVTGSGGEGLGIEVWNGCDRCMIEDNRIDHWLSIGGCDYCSVRRNVVSDHSGKVKFIGIEAIGSYLVFTDNVVDDGQQIGISVSSVGPKNYVYYGNNTVRKCIQWGAQFQGEKGGLAYQYLYKCRFLDTSVGRGKPWYPGDEGHGFRINGNAHHLTFEKCQFSNNGRYGLQVFGPTDFLSFVKCAIVGNRGPAWVGQKDYTALEWVDCRVEGNGDNALPAAKPFPAPAPTAQIEAPVATKAGSEVVFACRAAAASQKGAVVLWDLDDGAPLTGNIVKHVYERPGRYRMTMILWDATGRGTRVARDVEVRPVH